MGNVTRLPPRGDTIRVEAEMPVKTDDLRDRFGDDRRLPARRVTVKATLRRTAP